MLYNPNPLDDYSRKNGLSALGKMSIRFGYGINAIVKALSINPNEQKKATNKKV